MNKCYLIIPILLVSNFLSCVDKSKDQFGQIDKLTLRIAIDDIGFDTLKQLVKSHKFKKNQKPTPFTLSLALDNNPENNDENKALLYKRALGKYSAQLTKPIYISSDTSHNESNVNRIDNCTCIAYVNADKEFIKITAEFHNKQALLKVLNKLNKSE